LIAYFLALFMGHWGFAMHDPNHRQLASFIRDTMPAPPHTFVNQAMMLLPFIKILAVATIVAWTWSLVKPHLMGIPKTVTVPAPLDLIVVFVTLVPLIWMDVPRIHLYTSEESREFADFARSASYIADDSTIYINYPFRFMGQADWRLFFYRIADHANHYVQKEREQAEAALHKAIKANHLTIVNAILDKYDVKYLMRVDGESDEIVNRCGVETIPGPGVALLRRVPCR
jgi:hypothetical protein